MMFKVEGEWFYNNIFNLIDPHGYFVNNISWNVGGFCNGDTLSISKQEGGL